MSISAILAFIVGVVLYKYIKVASLPMVIVKDFLIFIGLSIVYAAMTCAFKLSYAKELFLRIKSKVIR